MARYGIEKFRQLSFDVVSSTNILVMEKARSGDPGLLWVTARQQTGGRGRRGRTWISAAGNLYASLLLIDPAPRASLGSLPLAVSVAVGHAVMACLPWQKEAVRIKWPNDVLVSGKKISGILIEVEDLADGRLAVVIGCGINVNCVPDNPLYPATALSAEGVTVSVDMVFAHLMKELAQMLEIWDEGRGVAEIAAYWKNMAQGIGSPVTVNLPDRSVSGIFTGIDDTGLMLLGVPGGEIVRIASGDVFFG